jgi:glycosidase
MKITQSAFASETLFDFFARRPRLMSFRLMSFLLAASLAGSSGLAEKAAISPPDWLRDGVIYEICPRDFSQTGDFNGITARLDHLKALGVNIVWLMPIHPIGEKMRKGSLGSPYAVKDYYAINRDYGTEADLKRLIAEAHRRGMKVLMDIVADHTAWDSVMMEHAEFYKQDAHGRIQSPVPEWTDVAALNYANPELRRYMLAMFRHWIDPAGFDFDGFRCDAAGMVPTSFWEEARAQLLEVKPDIALLAEASKPELMVKAFDIDYSWPLLRTLDQVLVEGAPASELARSWAESRRKFPPGTLHLQISDDHDESRAVSRFGVRGARAASVLMFTLDGVPLLYNGMEVGDATESGGAALFEKAPISWQPTGRPDLRRTYASLIGLRREFPAFRSADVTWLPNSDKDNIVSFMRSDDQNEFVVLINFSNRPDKVSVEVAHAAEFKDIRIPGTAKIVRDGLPELRLAGFDWRIYHRKIVP